MAQSQVLELPWNNGKSVLRDCFCSNRSLPMTVKSRTNIVEVHFTVNSMNTLDDYHKLYFEGVWDFEKAPYQCQQKRRMRGASGEIRNHSPVEDDEEVSCYNRDYLFIPICMIDTRA